MFIAALLRIRTIAAIAAALVLATVAYGFAASNDVAISNAGDGEKAISGYHVTNVTYDLNATDPINLDGLSFDIAPDNSGAQPDTVKVQLTAGGAWYEATAGTAPAWSVDLTPGNNGVPANTPVTVESVDNLRIVAADTAP